MDFNLKSLATELKPKERPTEDIGDLRHRSMMEAIAPYARETVQKNLTPVYTDYKTRDTKLVLVLCPEWSPYMPPFSLARLSGVAKASGYETHIMDLNVKAYNAYRDDWQPNNKLPFRLWDPSSSWHWLGDTYMNDIHPVLEPILSEAVDKIIEMSRVEMAKNPKLTDEMIEQGIAMTKKLFLPFAIAGAIFGTGFLGAIGSLIGAAVAKKNPVDPFKQDTAQ